MRRRSRSRRGSASACADGPNSMTRVWYTSRRQGARRQLPATRWSRTATRRGAARYARERSEVAARRGQPARRGTRRINRAAIANSSEQPTSASSAVGAVAARRRDPARADALLVVRSARRSPPPSSASAGARPPCERAGQTSTDVRALAAGAGGFKPAGGHNLSGRARSRPCRSARRPRTSDADAERGPDHRPPGRQVNACATMSSTNWRAGCSGAGRPQPQLGYHEANCRRQGDRRRRVRLPRRPVLAEAAPRNDALRTGTDTCSRRRRPCSPSSAPARFWARRWSSWRHALRGS